jgi:DNA-binding GntR family transcriptional regulator
VTTQRRSAHVRVVRDSVESLADQVHRALLKDILAGAYEPGERLNEGVLARRFGVSKSPVREALARLVGESQLEVYPRIGYAVTAITADDVEDLFEYRTILEGAAAELAATRITTTELQRLDVLTDVAFSARARETYAAFFAQNREFHLQIARASRNAHLVRALAGVFDKVDRALRYRLDVDTAVERMQTDHRRLVDVLRSSDGALAKRLAIEQIREGKDRVIEGLLVERFNSESEPQTAGE